MILARHSGNEPLLYSYLSSLWGESGVEVCKCLGLVQLDLGTIEFVQVEVRSLS